MSIGGPHEVLPPHDRFSNSVLGPVLGGQVNNVQTVCLDEGSADPCGPLDR